MKRSFHLPFLQQRKLVTFLFFVVLSSAFWFVRSLSEQYEASITYPVRYVNLPENKVLIGNVPEKLKLRVHAKGFTILRSKLNLNLIPLRFNVNSYLMNSSGTDSFYVVTESVKEILSGELGNVSILAISPDTLFFRFTEMVVKRIAVKPVLAMHDKFFYQQYMQNGKISIDPDSIIISGPGSIVRTITQVLTEPLHFTGLSDTVVMNCKIEPIDRVTFSQQLVKVSIPVDRFTEVEEMHAVVPVNVPDSLSMIAIPGQVTLTYRICLSNYNRVINNPLIPRIDYTTIQENRGSRLIVFLTDTPVYVNHVRFNPKETEFLITRK
jgi:hypothetical protein